MQIKFYDKMEDSHLKFAVIIAKMDGKYVFCKHRERSTYEIPGGHREDGESILDAAKRELYEETGAVKYEIKPVTAPDEFDGAETFGGLFYAEIKELEKELHSEIERIAFFDEVPQELTYPLIQPKLIDEAKRRGFIG